ncbi:hypothetical protein GmHk_19G055072 [Glycine max]|nr:hypothetical protein GmHk_19G055072 [Glycine max]
MVRTRGLGRALGRVIGRALGREDRHDSDDAPQRRRPTTSARRQQGAVLVAEDELVLPADEPVVPTVDPVVASDEPMIDADVQDTGAEAVADEPEGFLGGPRDALVLTKYANHVAASERQLGPRQDIAMDHTYAYLGYEIYISANVKPDIGQLQLCWIYEHFPSVAECIVDPDYDEVSPRACRWIAMKKTVKTISTETYRQHLDRLRIPNVC